MRLLKRFAQPLLFILVVGLLARYIHANWSEFADLSIVHPIGLVISMLLVIASLYSSGMVNDLTIEPHGIHPTKKEVFGLAAITRFLNQITPNYVGASARAVYFKQRYSVSYAKFSSSFLVANVLQLITASFIAILSYILFVNGVSRISDLTVIIVMLAVLFAVLHIPTAYFDKLFKKMYEKHPSKALERLSILPGEYSKVRSHPKLFRNMLVWMAILIAISGFIIHSLFYALGYPLDTGVALFIAAVTNLSIVLSVTPAGLGVREGMLVFGGSLAGIPVPISLAVSILLRIVMTLAAGLVSIFFIPMLRDAKRK